MSIIFCGAAPHPPVLLPEVGGEDAEVVNATYEAMMNLANQVKDSEPEVLIVISSHGFIFQDGIGINGSAVMKGSLAKFGAPQVNFEVKNDLQLTREIQNQAAKLGIPTAEIDGDVAREYGFQTSLDHGFLVPYYFLDKVGLNIPVVSVSMGLLPYEELYAFGLAMQRAAQAVNRKVALIASGDMSHCLTPDRPDYHPDAKEFDRQVVDIMSRGDAEALIKLDPDLIEKAGECGLRPFIMLMGSLEGRATASKVLSYEGPFGVGYMVAALVPGAEGKPSLMEKLFAEREAKIRERRAQESPLVSLARQSLEYYITQGEPMDVPVDIPEDARGEAGVFVSIKKHGQLRGCIGTTAPTTTSVAEEIINNAISAGVYDPRFLPVEEEELQELVYSVDVLAAPEPVSGPDELDPHRYGVIVKSGPKSGLLLPNLEGIDTVEEQLAIARHKAGIEAGEPVELERFEVVRYK